MIKIPKGTVLDELLVCVETRSTLEDEHVIYSLSNGYDIEIIGPIATNAVFKVSVSDHSGVLTIYDRVGREQLITHLELAATCK